MTRQEAASEVAIALGDLLSLARMPTETEGYWELRSRTQAVLAHALLMLTDPAATVREFLDAPLADSPSPPANLCFTCRGAFHESTWEEHIATPRHQRAHAVAGAAGRP